MRTISLFLSMMMLVGPCFAQSEELNAGNSNKFQFTSIQQAYIAGNDVQAVPGFQLLAGLRYQRVSVYAGIAVDPYFAYSFPLFIDTRYTFLRKRLHAYCYGDLGINKLTYSDQRFPKKNANGQRLYKLHPGLYYDYGIGLNTKISGTLWYNLSVGVSYKETKYDSFNWWSGKENKEVWRNVASRFTVKMGLMF